MAAQGAKQLGGAGCLGTKLCQASKVHVVHATGWERHARVAAGSRGVEVVKANRAHSFVTRKCQGSDIAQGWQSRRHGEASPPVSTAT